MSWVAWRPRKCQVKQFVFSVAPSLLCIDSCEPFRCGVVKLQALASRYPRGQRRPCSLLVLGMRRV